MTEAIAILTPKLLWIADQPGEIVNRILFTSMVVVESAIDGIDLLRNEDFDVVLVSLPCGGVAGAEGLLEELQRTQPATPVLLHAPDATATETVRLLQLGAFHVLSHGDANSVLYLAANAKWSRQAERGCLEPEPWRRLLIGQSRAIEQIAEQIRLVAPRRCTVLITGETGTGKELVAQSIHAASGRDRVPLVAVNCSALPESLLEAELFGHVKGAFTGAMSQRIGRFEQAHHGTIFLDEIGDMPLSLQSKLLRVLQEREFQRLGSSETIHLDVRVIAATNTDLAGMIQERKFREDLYYRLNVVPLALPPLRERAGDIGILARHFIERTCRDERIPIKQISRETLDRLAGHDWPGNVRQLENAVEKAVILSGDRPILFPSDFSLPPRKLPIAVRPGAQPFVAVPDQGLDFERTVGSIELNILEQALRKTGGNKKLAAEMLRLKRTTLTAKLKSLAAVGAAG